MRNLSKGVECSHSAYGNKVQVRKPVKVSFEMVGSDVEFVTENDEPITDLKALCGRTKLLKSGR